MNKTELFAALFNGYTKRYGRYDLTGEVSDKSKHEGRARTVDAVLTTKLYGSHLAGKIGIGVIPLREDDHVNFAAIDIDVYTDADQTKRNLTHEDVAKALFDTPLIVTRSKSNGIHVWLFAAEPVKASLAVGYLNSIAASLGAAGTEVFPKQTQRANDQDIGNWINLPYFGGDKRLAVLPSIDGSVTSFKDIDLDTFLVVAGEAAKTVTNKWLKANTLSEPSQRDSGDKEDLWLDGPPCLQSLCHGWPRKRARIEKQFAEGLINDDQRKKQLSLTYPQLEQERNNVFKEVAIYVRRRTLGLDPDGALDKDGKAEHARELDAAHDDWTAQAAIDFGVDPRKIGIKSELGSIAHSISKGKWGYACTKGHIKPWCNRKLCMKRKFGVGVSQSDMPEIADFTIMTSVDRQYFMDVGACRIHIADAETLLSQARFAVAVLNQADFVWQLMPDPKYKELISQLIEDAKKHNRVVEPPPDSDRAAILFNLLNDFIYSKRIAKGKNDAAIHSGRAVWSENETEAMFKLGQFMDYVRNAGHSWTHSAVSKMLIEDFCVTARGNTTIGDKQVRPYVVNIVAHKALVERGVNDG